MNLCFFRDRDEIMAELIGHQGTIPVVQYVTDAPIQ